MNCRVRERAVSIGNSKNGVTSPFRAVVTAALIVEGPVNIQPAIGICRDEATGRGRKLISVSADAVAAREGDMAAGVVLSVGYRRHRGIGNLKIPRLIVLI